jgi:hypothetical protein
MELHLIVTLVSLAVAIVMSLVAWRLVRDERERSAARIEALAHDIESEADGAADEAPVLRVASRPPAAGTAAGGVEAVPAAALFEVPEATASPPAWQRLGTVVAIGALLVGGVIGVAVLLADRPGAQAQGQAGAPAAAPLELLSLRHAQQDGTFTVTGLVRNPARGAPAERITAVVFLFDAQGGFLASGRAPLDFTRLAPGEESPFVVAIPAPAGVARYRVSFRRDEGGVVSHIDRREAGRH